MRTLVDIPAEDIRALDALSKCRRVPRAKVIRAAIADYLARNTQRVGNEGFGLWGEAGEDGLAYQERLRAEW